MCHPAVVIAMMVVSTAVTMMGQQQQADAAKKSAEYTAAVNRNNAQIAEWNAQDAEARGAIAERKQALETTQLMARQRAGLAANGVVIDSGSALDITSDTAAFGRLDALTVRSNAQREALGFRTQGMNYNAEADLASYRGKAAGAAARTQMLGTALGGASQVATKWYGFNAAGSNVLS